MEEYKRTFTANYARLCEAVPVEQLLPELVSRDVITVQEMEEILAETTPIGKSRTLLNQYGVVDGAYLWFESYLSDRRQCVKFQGHLSEWGAVSVGVPQGSILGPLLFSIFVNDLPSVVSHSQINLYSDDTELHHCGHSLSSVQHGFQCDLDAIYVWLCVNRLQLNVSKSVAMLIGTRQKINRHNVSVHISGQTLTQVSYTIDQFLTWQKHTEYILQRIRGKVHCLNRLRPLSGSILFRLYCGFILPIFDYCDTVWSPPTALLSKSMERIHARFVGHMSGALSFVKATLAERRHFHTIVQVYKILHLLVPTYLQDMFMFSDTLTGHAGRNSHRLFIPRMRTSYGQKSLCYRGAVAWNNLDRTLYSATSLQTFVSSYKLLYR